MDEYIKKADVFEYLSALRNWVLKNPLSTLDTMFVVMEMFDFVDHKVESADVAPVRHGWWKDNKCTACGEEAFCYGERPYHLRTDFCPMCGAKMDLEG